MLFCTSVIIKFTRWCMVGESKGGMCKNQLAPKLKIIFSSVNCMIEKFISKGKKTSGFTQHYSDHK